MNYFYQFILLFNLFLLLSIDLTVLFDTIMNFTILFQLTFTLIYLPYFQQNKLTLSSRDHLAGHHYKVREI